MEFNRAQALRRGRGELPVFWVLPDQVRDYRCFASQQGSFLSGIPGEPHLCSPCSLLALQRAVEGRLLFLTGSLEEGSRPRSERKPEAPAWLIFRTQLVHSLAVPDSSARVCKWTARHLFLQILFFTFFWAFERQLWHSPQRKEIHCGTKERIKGAVPKDLGSSAGPLSRAKSVPLLPAADGNRRPSPTDPWFAHSSPSSSYLSFPWGVHLVL